MLIFISAFCTALNLMCLGPSFCLAQVMLRENSSYILCANIVLLLIFLYRRNTLFSLIHLLFAGIFFTALLPYLSPAYEIRTHSSAAVPIETIQVAYGKSCIFKDGTMREIAMVPPPHDQPLRPISVMSASSAWENQKELLTSLDIPSKRLFGKNSFITLDLINLPAPSTNDTEYYGRIGLRRLVGELRDKPKRRILIGGVNSALYSERVFLIRKGARLHEIGWHEALFLNRANLSPFALEKFGYSGIWLSQDLVGETISVNKCPHDGIVITINIFAKEPRTDVRPPTKVEKLIQKFFTPTEAEVYE